MDFLAEDGENPNTPPFSVTTSDKSRVASKDRFMLDDSRRADLGKDFVRCIRMGSS